MPLHGLGKVTLGVPNVDDTIAYYTDFGLGHRGGGVFATRNGGDQLEIVHAPTRRLVELTVAADDPDDIAAITGRLSGLGVAIDRNGTSVGAVEPVTGTRVRVAIRPRIVIEPAVLPTPYNGPGRIDRWGRAPFLTRAEPVRPRKLGHAVIGSTDLETTMRFFTKGLGFQVSDYMGDKAAFLRCSVEHHNVLVMSAPVNFMHHTSWQVDDIDEVGRGAHAMLDGNPERHIWGLGRHYAGANFFWYLKDPAGNFSEYYSDMDTVPEDELWSPEVLHGLHGLYAWGPPPPPSFLEPDDLAALMTGAHSSTG
ncbi:glyoxalase/bleomycin resistance protein/dioxygenase superfamily protein [Rhodococcus wratislaviensis]|uniref:Dioxygenase n=1 Tax=Rhodococcus wratislaviensis TaxID=44752 RepID=A0AB38FIN2_RHOWR|nr:MULTISPECIES: VOC family protein [Rhodococcus]REE73530.1 glyoxalase/bleomycin resistance protein/dioxygenase superfamily protein [Rhodococcus wratislaviensis]WAM17328.1 VOC family protein [Rhodococcus sp. JS3073]SPZ41389.1 dioxygenase [Rhodococcus wratislaviensis]